MPQFGMAGETGNGPYTRSPAIWPAALAVAVGDAVWQNTSSLNPSGLPYNQSAANYTGATNHTTTQTSFKGVFCGYSTARRTTLFTSDGSDITDGPILSEGEFTKPCTALGSAANVGAYVGPAQGAGGALTLDPQAVEIVTNPSYAIGRLSKAAAVGATWLTFRIFPVIVDSGVQAQA